MKRILLGICIVGILLRFAIVSKYSFNLDEAFSANYIADRNPFEIIIDSFKVDFHPPVYYLVLKIWSYLFGSGDIALRSMSVLIGTATILAAYALGSVISKKRIVGILSASLVSVSPVAIAYSCEARMYAAIALLFTMLLLALATKRTTAALIVFTLLAYSHALAGVMALPAVIIYAGIWPAITASILYVPWVVRMLFLTGDGKRLWELDLEHAWRLLKWLLFYGEY